MRSCVFKRGVAKAGQGCKRYDDDKDLQDAETPAWSRGRAPGTGIKRRATRASEVATEGDEVADFEDRLEVKSSNKEYCLEGCDCTAVI